MAGKDIIYGMEEPGIREIDALIFPLNHWDTLIQSLKYFLPPVILL